MIYQANLASILRTDFSALLLQDIDKYSTFSVLPRDISQQIFDELVRSQRLTDVSLEAFRDCALQVCSHLVCLK